MELLQFQGPVIMHGVHFMGHSIVILIHSVSAVKKADGHRAPDA